MRKMLVIFLILLSKVLADSEENNYVDLLPDEEKQEFLDKVARRILQDVESQENATVAANVEISDEQLKQHSEYVKTIFKEEQANLRKSRGNIKDEEVITSSDDEKDSLDVKPLKTKRRRMSNAESVDLTQQEVNTSNKTANNNITPDTLSNNDALFNVSVQGDNANKTPESDETSAGVQKVLETINTNETSNELQAETKKSENVNVTVEAKIPSANISEENTKGKDSNVTEITDTEDEDGEETKLEKSNSRSKEDDARNVSVKSIHERRIRKSIENITDSESTTSAVVYFSVKPAENHSDVYNKESSVNEEEFTTLTSALESNSTKSSKTASISSESNSTKDSVTESISSESVSNESNSTKSSETTSISSESNSTKVSATESISSESVSNESNSSKSSETERISGENISNESNSTEKPTTNVPLSETTTITTNEDKVTELVMKSRNDTSERTEDKPEATAEGSKSSTLADKTTTDFLLETVTDAEIVEEKTESTTVPVTTEYTTVNIPVVTTQETKIVLEDFTSTPTPASSIGTTIVKPITVKLKKKMPAPQELTTETLYSDEETMEATTKKREETKTNKHNVIVHKLSKIIVGPKAKKNAELDKEIQNKNFIELEKAYYDEKVKVGKEYHVYEVPNGETPYIKDKDPVAAEQPYYVPVYNYSPNNAYFNPLNRLGPNAGDSKENIRMINDDEYINIYDDDDVNQQLDRRETISYEMDYDGSNARQRKKFGGKYSLPQSTLKQPLPSNGEHNTRGKVNPADYLDSDYYFGRIRNELATRKLGKSADIITRNNLKDHLQAVRNIMFQQKLFGVLENDAMNIERSGRITRNGIDDSITANSKKSDNQNNIVLDLIREAEDGNSNIHFKKVGYLKGQNGTKEVYVIDNHFKENVDKYIQEKVFTPATPIPYEAKNMESREEVSINFKPHGNKTSYSTASDIKLNVRRNSVVKVGIYLQVLSDMISLDNKALTQYDWLGTTVDIQAALQKLFELNALVVNNEDIHPSDMEIVKYLLFLHKLATEIIEANDIGAQLRKFLPRNKKKKFKPRLLKEKGLINRVWLYLRKEVHEVDDYKALKHLNTFLMHIEDGLYDLHEAIKNIAKITKYNNQHWYQNLKDLYIDLDEKHLLELLLHFSALRLFALVEESAKNGLEEDYIQYMKENRNHSKKTLEEMMFIMKILDEYKRLVK